VGARQRPRLTVALIAAAFASLLLASPLYCSPTSQYRDDAQNSESDGVPRALLDQARISAATGDWGTADACLTEARSSAPLDSDILYLSALARAKLGKPLDPALSMLSAAEASGRFEYYSKHDTSLLMAEFLVRERRWNEALNALGTPTPTSSSDPAYELIRARALAFSGQDRAFASEISAALRRFPDDSAFARLFISRMRSYPASAEERAIGDTIVSRLQGYAVADPELPVLATSLMPDQGARRDAVLSFRAAGGKSASATLRALEYGIIDEARAAAEMLSGAYPVKLDELSTLYSLAGSPAGEESVRTALGAWSGDILVDDERDGICEGRISLDKGSTIAYMLDSRQAGNYDFQAEFSEGSPSEIKTIRGETTTRAIYRSYPAVSSVSFEDSAESHGYSFGPEASFYAPLAMRAFAGGGKDKIMLPYAVSAAEPSELSCAALALSVEQSASGDHEIAILEHGVPVSSTAYREGRVYSICTYQRGRRDVERIDADGDGRFETERVFGTLGDGSWGALWAKLDADGDGVIEYREELSFPFLKEWDYDGNGSVDARQRDRADGSVIKEFSSRLDGRLDEAIVVKSDKIVSLTRNGTALALVPDSNPSLTWIGRKPFDLGGNLPPGEGVFTSMGKRYTMTRLGILCFAELVP